MKQLITLAALFWMSFVLSQNKRIDSLTVQLAFENQDSTKVETSLHLIKSLYNVKDYQKALLYINQTKRLSETLNYPQGIAESCYYQALIYTDRNDYYNAIDSYNRSRKVYQQLNDTLGIAKVNNSIGLIEIRRGNYLVGLNNSLSAIQIFEEKNLQEELSTAYNNLADAYFNTNQLEKSLEFNLKALSVRTRLQDTVGIKISTKNAAVLYSMRKEHRKAIEYYEKVIALLDDKNDKVLRGEILPRIGAEYLQFRDYDVALDFLNKGLSYNRSNKNPEGILRSLNALADLNIQQRRLKTAEIQLSEAQSIAKSIDKKDELLYNYKLYKTLESERGYFQNAFFWQEKYYVLKEELDELNKPQIPEYKEPIALQPSTEDSLKEEVKPNQENKTATNQDKEVQKLKLISYGLSIAVVIVLTILLLIYLKRKNRIKYTRELEDKNKKINIQNKAFTEQKERLEESNKVKDRLFSIVSHDLKDSISSIKGCLDLLKEGGMSQEEFDGLIPELSDNANNASMLLFNLLNWSKSQMQNLEPNAELFNIQDVFHEKMSLVEQKVDEKRIVLIDESQRDFVYADRSMIEIVIQNLIANAVKFSRVGDIITVSNRDKGGKALLCIEDTGVGISEENIDKLFGNNTFTTRGTKNEKGTGLGLTICKEMVEQNNGRIWVESELNLGSKFFVELPKSKLE
ncbi:MAG: ATP-binding protein [Bacteroidetes bacterium MedPE-SWsnd-G2]|nr:MAG: ATP-binding protein [Bacteroidetes bacterium MedPE-SWsnd-G2]